MKKNIVFLVILIVIIAGAFLILRRNHVGNNPSVTPTPSPSAIKPTSNDIDITKFTKPATCRVSGSIKFTQKNLYISDNAKIDYTGIDTEARLINWTITPNDDLSVGPNIFASLDIPDGSRSITVGLPDQPKARQYTLTATVAYGRWVNNTVVVKDVRCSGSLPVTLSY